MAPLDLLKSEINSTIESMKVLLNSGWVTNPRAIASIDMNVLMLEQALDNVAYTEKNSGAESGSNISNVVNKEAIVTTEPKIPSGSIIQVFGWIMMDGLYEGKFRAQNLGDDTYQFYKPRGRKSVCRHYISSVDVWVKPSGDPNWNRIEIVEK